MASLSASDIIFEDNHLLVVNKKSGILVQSDETGDIPLVDLAKDYLKKTYRKPGEVFCGVVHRLDRPVSGMVLLAKTSKALSRLNAMFRDNQIQKYYLAEVYKRPKNDADVLLHYLIKNKMKHYAIAHTQEVKGSQRAELSFIYLCALRGRHMLLVKPVTGRFHQIRCQLSKIGSTIVGDVKYGYHNPLPDKSIHLHAVGISFTHPVKNEPIILTCKPNWISMDEFESIGAYFK